MSGKKENKKNLQHMSNFCFVLSTIKQNKPWKRLDCWEQKEAKVLKEVRWKKWQCWGKRTDTDTTIADREHGKSICVWHLWLPAPTLIFPNNYFCLSNTLLFHCVLLYFHETTVTDVIAYQQGKHWTDIIT